MSWYSIKGSIKTAAGTSGTVTLASGSRVLQIIFAGGTCVLPTGDGSTTQTITGVAGQVFALQEHHAARVLQGTGAQLNIVFSGTTSYFVEYIGPAGAS